MRLSERGVLRVVWALTGLRAALAPAFELFPQEAYYDLYAHHPALSYFDHPPAIAWALEGFESVFGHSLLTLRLCAFALTALTQAVYWRLVSEALPGEDASDRRVAALMLLATPALSVLSLIATPDVPLVLCAAVALLCFWRIGDDPAHAPRWWLGAGLATGLAFDAKYSALFLPLGAALWLGLEPARRAALRTPWPWLAAALGLLASAPVLVWNASHSWASFRFQTVDRLAASGGFTFRHAAALIGSQTALVGLGFGLALWAGVRVLWRPPPPEWQPAARFFLAFGAAPLLGGLALSLAVQVKPNWLYAFYLAAFPLVALALDVPRRFSALSLGGSVLVLLAGALELLAYPVPIHSLDTCVGWRELSAEVRAWQAGEAEAHGVDFAPFVAAGDGYKTSAELEFWLGQKVYGPNVIGRPGLAYDYLGDDLRGLRGKEALFLRAEPEDLSPSLAPAPADLVAHFASVEPLDPIFLHFGTRVVRKVSTWHCKGYRGP